MIFIVIALIAVIIYLIWRNNKNSQNNIAVKTTAEKTEENIEETKEADIDLPYYRKNLMTKNEWYFYKQLKPIADELNLSILCKVRVADIVDIKKGLDKGERQRALNRINKKHIDFILCNPENLYPELLIELDDSSHNTDKAKERDQFIEALYKKTGYKLLRVTGGNNIKDKIEQALKEEENKAEK